MLFSLSVLAELYIQLYRHINTKNALKTCNIKRIYLQAKNNPALPLFACMFVYLRGLRCDISKHKRVKNLKRTLLNHN